MKSSCTIIRRPEYSEACNGPASYFEVHFNCAERYLYDRILRTDDVVDFKRLAIRKIRKRSARVKNHMEVKSHIRHRKHNDNDNDEDLSESGDSGDTETSLHHSHSHLRGRKSPQPKHGHKRKRDHTPNGHHNSPRHAQPYLIEGRKTDCGSGKKNAVLGKLLKK